MESGEGAGLLEEPQDVGFRQQHRWKIALVGLMGVVALAGVVGAVKPNAISINASAIARKDDNGGCTGDARKVKVFRNTMGYLEDCEGDVMEVNVCFDGGPDHDHLRIPGDDYIEDGEELFAWYMKIFHDVKANLVGAEDYYFAFYNKDDCQWIAPYLLSSQRGKWTRTMLMHGRLDRAYLLRKHNEQKDWLLNMYFVPKMFDANPDGISMFPALPLPPPLGHCKGHGKAMDVATVEGYCSW